MTSFPDSSASTAALTEFLGSLPVTYRSMFDAQATAEHAAIVARRAGSHHFEVWRHLPDEMYVLCLVADDRPGLLSTVTTALTAVGFHIDGAQIFTRKSSPTNEALDFFWVRLDPPLTAADVFACVQKLNARLQRISE